jgi:hypothetical protein
VALVDPPYELPQPQFGLSFWHNDNNNNLEKKEGNQKIKNKKVNHIILLLFHLFNYLCLLIH